MIRVLSVVVAAAMFSGCGPTTTKDAAGLSATGCGNYERSRLAGMRMGSRFTNPDPDTPQGKAILEERAFLEAICEPS